RCKFAQQKQKSRQKPGIARLFEPAAQYLESGAEIVALRDHQADKAAGPDVPQTYRVALGMIKQHCSIAFGGIKIARPEGDRARPPGRARCKRTRPARRRSLPRHCDRLPAAPVRQSLAATICGPGNSASIFAY